MVNTRFSATSPAKYTHIGIGVARRRRSHALRRSVASSAPKENRAWLTTA
jgi:hypothetical protein